MEDLTILSKKQRKKSLIGELFIMQAKGLKPNYSALARKYKFNRATIKKYHINGGVKNKVRKPSKTKFDEYDEEIIELLETTESNYNAIYQYLLNKHGELPFTYSGLKAHIHKLGYRKRGVSVTPHVRYETAPGEQIQVDWKECLKMTSKYGEIFEFNIFSATLGFSRLHLFVYTIGKTEEDFFRCLITVFNRIGGVTDIVKTDNMSAIVSIKGDIRSKHSAIKQFEADTGIKIKLCEVRRPMTKGKVEVSNKFMDWLKPYEGKFEDESELISIIDKITVQANEQTNSTTGIPPIKLFIKEKEHLKPLPPKLLLESYLKDVSTQNVPNTLLVNYKGSQYSVPQKYIGKRVKLVPINNTLYIYYNSELIVCHEITTQKINYDLGHYSEALMTRLNSTDEAIEKMAKENLERFKEIK